jgi:hypothetical protein
MTILDIMVPGSKKDKVVYLSLDSVIKWNKTVKVNPLEVSNPPDVVLCGTKITSK